MILEVGSINVDFIIQSQKNPLPGETVYGKNVSVMTGGKGANQIAAAARLGADTILFTKMGEIDKNNEILYGDLKWAGVSTKYIELVPNEYTGSAYCMIEDSAQNSIIIIDGANKEIDSEYIGKYKDLIAKANIVICEFGVNQETCDYVMKLAKKLGVTTVCNPAPFRTVDPNFYKNVDIITPNEIEAAEICGFPVVDEESASKACEFFHNLGVDKVIITMGNQGAFCSNRVKKQMIPSYQVKAVDTTGAGDCFNGSFAYAYEKGYDFFECARFANAAASLSVQKLGAMPSMPSLKDVEKIFTLN